MFSSLNGRTTLLPSWLKIKRVTGDPNWTFSILSQEYFSILPVLRVPQKFLRYSIRKSLVTSRSNGSSSIKRMVSCRVPVTHQAIFSTLGISNPTLWTDKVKGNKRIFIIHGDKYHSSWILRFTKFPEQKKIQ